MQFCMIYWHGPGKMLEVTAKIPSQYVNRVNTSLEDVISLMAYLSQKENWVFVGQSSSKGTHIWTFQRPYTHNRIDYNDSCQDKFTKKKENEKHKHKKKDKRDKKKK